MDASSPTVSDENVENATPQSLSVAQSLALSAAKPPRIRCGNCSGCTNKADCGQCVNCLDKPRFGGAGVIRKGCHASTCTGATPAGQECDAIDIGANMGTMSKYMLSTGARVRAIEPQKDLSTLAWNTACRNGWGGRMMAFNNAVTSVASELADSGFEKNGKLEP